MDKALQTQLANIEKRTGKSLEELTRLVKGCGLTKHGEIRTWLQTDLGMGYGDANTLVHVALQTVPAASEGTEDDAAATDRIYAGPKAALRATHDAVMAEIAKFGAFETAPKKAYLSLRRKKQFATVGPATKTQIEIGLNMKGVPGTARLEALPPGGMCQYRVRLSGPAEVNPELVGWIRRAYDGSA